MNRQKRRQGQAKQKGMPPELPDNMELKPEIDLKALVLAALHDAGFGWIESVELEKYALRIPNWRIKNIAGQHPPEDPPIATIVAHPSIQQLMQRYLLAPVGR